MPVSVSADLLREHLQYTAWASQRLVHAIEHLSPEQLTHDFQTSERSILGTLVHIFAGDRVWLSRVQGEPRSNFVSEDDYNLHVLQIDWPLIYDRWHEWAANLTDENTSEAFAYHDLKGNPWVTSFGDTVLHLVNHGTHHRGQVSGFLRALGHVPPPLDLIHYYRHVRK
jgi:uncharacterized damage-inducible protein DinB